jgi:predicted PurR-regulated permease PerM
LYPDKKLKIILKFSRKKMSGINNENTQNVYLENLSKDIDKIKNVISEMYVPKHFENLMTKIGEMERKVNASNNTVNSCYNFITIIVLLFVCLVFAIGFILRKVDYWRAFLRTTNLGTYHRARKTCRSCYRPWKTSQVPKESMSSPEYLLHHAST